MPYSLHPYQYAYSAPTTWSDPSGEVVGAIIVVAVVGVAAYAWLATPSTVNAPAPDAVTFPADHHAGDLAFLETAPSTGDVNDISATVTGHSFSGEPQNRVLAAGAAVTPFITVAALRRVATVCFGGSPTAARALPWQSLTAAYPDWWRAASYQSEDATHELHRAWNGDLVNYSKQWRRILAPEVLAQQGTDTANLLNFVGAQGTLTPEEVIKRIPADWEVHVQQEGPGLEFFDSNPLPGQIDSVRLKAPDPRFNKMDYDQHIQLRVGRTAIDPEQGDKYGNKVYYDNTGAVVNCDLHPDDWGDREHIKLPLQ